MKKIIKLSGMLMLCMILTVFSGIRSLAVSSLSETDDGLVYSIGESGDYITIEGFSDSGFTVVIPDEINGIKVTKIAARAFYGKEYITAVTVGNFVEEIGEGAFSFCTSLKSADLGTSIKSLPQEVFRGCTALKKVRLPQNLEKIDQRAFADCAKLGKLHIPESVSCIDDEAFTGCYRLIFDAKGNRYALEYASSQHIAFSYWESDSWIITRVVIISAAAIIIFLYASKVLKWGKKRKR